MACRIGITTDPDQRKRFWRAQHPDMRNWHVLDQFSTKTLAQQFETRTAQNLGCKAAPGGDGPETATWSVYFFNNNN